MSARTGAGGAATPPLLVTEGVRKTYGGVVANADVSITVGAGEIVGIIGPNGSGKTTLFNAIAGTVPIDAGRIRFAGREISRLRVAEISRLGLKRTFQQTRVFGRMRVIDNMLVSSPVRRGGPFAMLGRAGAAERARAEDVLGFVGLYAKRRLPAGELSFGQQKLLEFAMALVSEPKLLLLDEPTAGINPTLIGEMIERLRRTHQTMGVTLLVIEHNMRVIMDLAERIYCLAHGQLLAEGSPDAIRADPRVIDAYLGAR